MPTQLSNRLPTLLHTTLLTIAISLAYWWLHVPELQPYSLQAFAGVALFYFLAKTLSKSRAWHILPAFMSVETALASLAFLLLIGATGNTSSWFYPLSYVHLFFITFSSQIGTSIWVTMMLMLFHYGLTPGIVQHELVSLATMPVVMVFFIFAKLQHQEVIEEKLIIQQEEAKLNELESEEFLFENFLSNFLQPKLIQLEKLAAYPQNLNAVRAQLKAIAIEAKRLLAQLQETGSSTNQD